MEIDCGFHHYKKKMEVDRPHIEKENTNVTRHALEWNPQGNRKRGRPKNTLRKDLSHEAQKIGKTWGEMKMVAKDRKKWNEAVIALCPLWDKAD